MKFYVCILNKLCAARKPIQHGQQPPPRRQIDYGAEGCTPHKFYSANTSQVLGNFS
jgi:hypothetical protein